MFFGTNLDLKDGPHRGSRLTLSQGIEISSRLILKTCCASQSTLCLISTYRTFLFPN